MSLQTRLHLLHSDPIHVLTTSTSKFPQSHHLDSRSTFLLTRSKETYYSEDNLYFLARSTKSCTWRVLCWRAQPGFEPGTSRTRSANHTPRPLSQAEREAPQFVSARTGPSCAGSSRAETLTCNRVCDTRNTPGLISPK